MAECVILADLFLKGGEKADLTSPWGEQRMPIVGRGGYEWQTIKFPPGLNGCQFLRKYSCNKNSPQNIADREMRTFRILLPL
jgi:hypothetical protein